MAGLADLFSVEDFQAKGKTSKTQKGGAKKKEGGKTGSTSQRGVRYPLPVRVCAGHIRCVLQKSEFSGKTVLEDEIKKRIRKEYPELAGIDISLVKFDNSYTKAIEAVEKKRLEKGVGEGAEKTLKAPVEAESEEQEEQKPLEFAGADEDAADDMEDASGEEMDEESLDEEGAESEEDDGEESAEGEKTESLPGYDAGCWIKLDIHYTEMKDTDQMDFPVTVKLGAVSQEYGEEYASLEAVREHWVSLHPEFAGCKFHYDDNQAILIPYMRGENEIKGKKYKLPLTVGYLGQSEQYEAKDFGSEEVEGVTMQQVRELYAKKYPEYENAIFAYHSETGHLFPVISFKKEDQDELCSVPVRVRGGGFVLELESADFAGKTAVTLEEIRAALEMVYPEFSKERTEMIYDERGFVIPVLKGSRKGYRITGLAPGSFFLQVPGKNGMMYRIEKNQFGCFDCREDGEEVDFKLGAPKIPGALLGEIVTFFKSDPDREAAVQIFYDGLCGAYELYYPAQRAGAARVDFARDPALEAEKLLVMDVHSHNRMEAFFSSVDDSDEKGTRLFLVIGRIDRDSPMSRLRAGIAGHYKELQLDDVFDMEGVGYELC